MKKINNQNGLTLVELMVASVIMILAFVGILTTFLRCLELNELSRSISVATTAAKKRMETIKNEDFADLVANYHNVSFTKSGFNGRGVSYIDSTDPNLYQVTVMFSFGLKNGRVIGEDADLDGVIDPGEDSNANGMLDSMIQLVTYVYNE